MTARGWALTFILADRRGEVRQRDKEEVWEGCGRFERLPPPRQDQDRDCHGNHAVPQYQKRGILEPGGLRVCPVVWDGHHLLLQKPVEHQKAHDASGACQQLTTSGWQRWQHLVKLKKGMFRKVLWQEFFRSLDTQRKQRLNKLKNC